MPASNSPGGKPPSDYKEVLYWKINAGSSRLAAMNLLSIPLAVVFGLGFFLFIRWFGKAPKFTLSNLKFLILLIGIVIVLAFHELLHGLLMQGFGARPRYGFFWGGLMFYAKAPGYAFKRDQYLLILLSPLVGLSIFACVAIVLLAGNPVVWVIALWAIVNASAAGADLWITAIVLRYPASTYVIDEMDGMRIFKPQGDLKIE